MNIQRDSNTVFELDESGVNRWSFHVQPGKVGKDRTPDDVLEDVAAKMSAVYDLKEALLGCMCAVRLAGREDDTCMEEAYKALAKYSGDSA